MIYEFPVKKEPDPPPVADNRSKMRAAGLLGQRQKKMVTSLDNSNNNFIFSSHTSSLTVR